METMKDLVKQVYEKYDIESEAELARLFNISPQAMNEYNSGRSKYFSDKVAYRIAELLHKDPAYVFLIREHQRARDQKIKGLWRDILEKVTKTAAALLLVVSFFPGPAKAEKFNITLSGYTLNELLIRFRLWLVRFMARPLLSNTWS